MGRSDIILISILRRDHQNNFLWASRLWVGSRKEPILGYVPKNDEKKKNNSGSKRLIRKKKSLRFGYFAEHNHFLFFFIQSMNILFINSFYSINYE